MRATQGGSGTVDSCRCEYIPYHSRDNKACTYGSHDRAFSEALDMSGQRKRQHGGHRDKRNVKRHLHPSEVTVPAAGGVF